MPSLPLEDVLARLGVQGSTTVGGSSYASFLPVLNSSGQLDTSFFTSTTSFYQVTTIGGGLASISNPTPGALAVLDGTSTWIYFTSSWLLISQLNSSGINFTPSGSSGLTSTNVQSAINELAGNAITVNTNSTITGSLTFNTAGAPFVIGSSSTGVIVPGLNSQYLGGYTSGYYLNASNLTSGTLSASLLAGTYNISITGFAQNAYLANTASALDVSRLNNSISMLPISSSLLSGSYNISITGNAATATTSTELNGQTASYYLNPANFTGGTLPSAAFNDTSHGARSGGTLHAIATDSVAGFLSASDKTKIDTVTSGAQPNQYAYSYISFGPPYAVASLSGTSVASVSVVNGSVGYASAPAVTLTGGGGTGATATATITNGTITAITVTNAGTGYTSAPTVNIASGYGTMAAASFTDTFTITTTAPLLTFTPNSTTNSLALGINVSNLLHNSLGGLTLGDPHSQYVNISVPRTITTQHTFNTGTVGSPTAPFFIGSGSTNVLVSGLNAQYLNGLPSSYFASTSYAPANVRLYNATTSSYYNLVISGAVGFETITITPTS